MWRYKFLPKFSIARSVNRNLVATLRTNGIIDVCRAYYVMFDVHISSSSSHWQHCTAISMCHILDSCSPETMAKLAYTGKTVKTNKLVIGIMVIQLISFRMCASDRWNENGEENVCSITCQTLKDWKANISRVTWIRIRIGWEKENHLHGIDKVDAKWRELNVAVGTD